MTVRVRYAPSPTGVPHVGNLRTALFNWLFARHEGGSFVLRVEDTDQTRLVPEALKAILDSLRWLGLHWDEGPEVGGSCAPYFQSQRLDLYRRAANELIAKDAAYRCFCSPERLEQARAEQTRRKEPPRYDRRCRNLSEAECRQEEAKGIVPVVRFKTPLDGRVEFDDIVRGHVAFENDTIDDFIILKSDGFPTYHLANVVDDHLMEISHVLRAEEWLPSTPRHLLLYAALGYAPPKFAHLPMILGGDRAKLSKRHGAVSLLEYRRRGYLPEAMFNFLGLLGWALDDHTEIISRDEFIRSFSLERIVKNPAIFDVEKLTWMNGVYMRALRPERLADLLVERLEDDLSPAVPRPLDRGYVLRIVPLVQERIKLLDEAAQLTAFFFVEGPLDYMPETLLGKRFTGRGREARKTLEVAMERLSKVERWEHDAVEGVLRPLATELGLKAGDLFMLMRVAVTGQTATPPLFETMEVLGRDRCLARLGDALRRIDAG
jgi:glutamyl-tRNA synthetase